MSTERKDNPLITWDRLSLDSQKLSFYIGLTSTGEPYLSVIARVENFDLEEASRELRQFDLLEKVTFIQELREDFERLKPKRDISKVDKAELTDEEKQYLRIKHSLEDYDRNPGNYQPWEEPRFRLTTDFREFIADMFPI